MRICENGVYRDATAEEVEQIKEGQRMARIDEASRTLTDTEILRLMLRKTVNSLTIDDATASRMVDYYPTLTGDGSLIKIGTKINWNGVLKQAAVDLWDTDANTPDAAPTLWVDIAYREGIRIIPETITAAQPFALDELGWWRDHVYRSTIAANVYTPTQYAAGWELLT